MPSNVDSSGFLIRFPWSVRRQNRAKVTSTKAISARTSERAARAASNASFNASLAELKAGDTAKIAGIGGTSLAKLHLMEMGLTPGTQLKVVRVAAFGGPLDIMIRGYRLSIRRDEAQAIEVIVADREGTK